MVEKNCGRGAALQRADLLKSRPAYLANKVPAIPFKPKFKPTFIIIYNPNLRGWLKETYFIRQKMNRIYPRPPSVEHWQSHSLQDHLARTSFKQLPHSDLSDQEDRPAGFYKHQHGRQQM